MSHARPTLSVCMIVRDEEAVLARCLDSIAGLYDELCILDTGSTDETLAIAGRYTDKIKVFTACNDARGKIIDFSLARNQALELATGDWVLQIDADEIIEQGKDRIARHLTADSYDRVGISIRSSSESSGTVSGRLFRRRQAKQYTSIIHEYLEFDGIMEVDRQIVISNLPDKTNKESGNERNIRLCRLMLESEPENSRIWYYLGREYQANADFGQAIDCYDKALEYGKFPYGRFQISYFRAVCLFLSRQFDSAIAAATAAAAVDPRYAEAHCLLGDIYFTLGEHGQAKENYQRALACQPPQDTHFGVQLWAYQAHPEKQLARLAD
ncbi:tetratricopeptide repeat protein [Thalassomonas viridans]|uniref:Tetratricopeptide repeat protein n=1 Tax=Thalassomonas viridans TaxID=137584 RepID=A0AAE9ZCB5_9GAMM|nr:glycosyltransferase family 2 protein [Thalassomonas viridans]WDE09274.1 tetratricopeptide repeat protein [Thalassomonas viridans]